MDTNKPRRVQLLEAGVALTSGDRDVEYGNPYDNLELAGKLKAVFWAATTRNVGHAEHEAIDMVLTKLSRLAQGKVKPDTYIDGATYFAIAGEVAEEFERRCADPIKDFRKGVWIGVAGETPPAYKSTPLPSTPGPNGEKRDEDAHQHQEVPQALIGQRQGV